MEIEVDYVLWDSERKKIEKFKTLKITEAAIVEMLQRKYDDDELPIPIHLNLRAIGSGRVGCGSRVHDSHVRIIIYEGIMWGEKTLYHKSWGVVKGININTKIKIIDYKGLSSDYASDIYINK